jgi:hypothetical protein
MWDLEVDLVCTGSGAAGLATAVSAVDFGGAVFIAASTHSDFQGNAEATARGVAERLHPWLDEQVSDRETTNYLAALSSDLGPMRHGAWETGLPISVVHETPIEPRRFIAPFYGARLREWAARCLASPYGYLHTRVSDWRTTTLHTAMGESIEVAEIGSMAPDPVDVGGSVLEWLTAQAHDRGIGIQPGCSLHRIVFEEGEVVGAVFTTSDGPLAVRARHGVTVATGLPHFGAAPPHQPSAGDADLRVCLVSRHASRFGRLELLTSEPGAYEALSTCRQGNRQLHVNLHETQGDSPVWRCGRAEGYPLLDQ